MAEKEERAACRQGAPVQPPCRRQVERGRVAAHLQENGAYGFEVRGFLGDPQRVGGLRRLRHQKLPGTDAAKGGDARQIGLARLMQHF